MKLLPSIAALFFSVLMVSTVALADSSCSAKNESGGSCSVSCPSGQSASCSDTTGANPPVCKCVSADGVMARSKKSRTNNVVVAKNGDNYAEIVLALDDDIAKRFGRSR